MNVPPEPADHQIGAAHETIRLDLGVLATFKFWRLQNANAGKLLKEIIFRWRAAAGYVRNKPGIWVVYPREQWCAWTGLSRNQIDRALKKLVDDRLINRERHRFAGREVRMFLQPTATALKHLGRPQDMTRLVSEKFSEKIKEKTTAKAAEIGGEKTGEKTDYTSIPSSPIKSTTSSSSILTSKGNDGQDEEDEENKVIAEYMLKKQKAADKLYPAVPGPHQKYVKHPSQKFAKWFSFSPELKDKWYKKYLTYVENWNSGKTGKQYLEWTEEDDAAFMASLTKAG